LSNGQNQEVEDELELEEKDKQSTKHYDEFKHEAFLMRYVYTGSIHRSP
jgi:hypothetical protein